MATKTKFTKKDFISILSNHSLGEYKGYAAIAEGTVQTNYILITSSGKYVFKYYENRPRESVLFESSLIAFLKSKKYPCPGIYKDKDANYVGNYENKPYVILEFIDGSYLDTSNNRQIKQLIREVAKLHNLTHEYKPTNVELRWNYSDELCLKLAKKEASKINTKESRDKLKWLEEEVHRLKLPKTLPKGICHCDLYYSNILFKNNKLVGLIDFDDANYTYLLFDLVGLIENEAWKRKVDEVLNFSKAKKVIKEYEKYRRLSKAEKLYLFDVYKLSILFDCVWYFSRGSGNNFFEKNKIDCLNKIGRVSFYKRMFF
jgi:homoserine kinase type II